MAPGTSTRYQARKASGTSAHERVHGNLGDALDVAQVLDQAHGLLEAADAPEGGGPVGGREEHDVLHEEPPGRWAGRAAGRGRERDATLRRCP
jgi:hypothetical protein